MRAYGLSRRATRVATWEKLYKKRPIEKGPQLLYWQPPPTGVDHSVSTFRLGWFCSLGFNGTVLVNSRTISCRQQGARSSQAVNKRQIFFGARWGMNNWYFCWELLTLFFPALEENSARLLMRWIHGKQGWDAVSSEKASNPVIFQSQKSSWNKGKKSNFVKNDVLCNVSRNRENNNCFLSWRAFATTSELKQNNIQKWSQQMTNKFLLPRKFWMLSKD